MLVLTRKLGEEIVATPTDTIDAGGSIIITILEIRGGRVSVGLSADSSVRFERMELVERREREMVGAGA